MHPELVDEWSEKNLPLTPDDITYGSNKVYWWIAQCSIKTKVRQKRQFDVDFADSTMYTTGGSERR